MQVETLLLAHSVRRNCTDHGCLSVLLLPADAAIAARQAAPTVRALHPQTLQHLSNMALREAAAACGEGLQVTDSLPPLLKLCGHRCLPVVNREGHTHILPVVKAPFGSVCIAQLCCLSRKL